MGFKPSTLTELQALRKRGEKPYGPVIVGDESAMKWARTNRFFGLDARDVGEDLTALSGLCVVVRMANPWRIAEAISRIALNAEFTTVYDTRNKHAEHYWS